MLKHLKAKVVANKLATRLKKLFSHVTSVVTLIATAVSKPIADTESSTSKMGILSKITIKLLRLATPQPLMHPSILSNLTNRFKTRIRQSLKIRRWDRTRPILDRTKLTIKIRQALNRALLGNKFRINLKLSNFLRSFIKTQHWLLTFTEPGTVIAKKMCWLKCIKISKINLTISKQLSWSKLSALLNSNDCQARHLDLILSEST